MKTNISFVTVILIIGIVFLTGCKKEKDTWQLILLNETKGAGVYTLQWDQTDQSGNQVETGNYSAIASFEGIKKTTPFTITNNKNTSDDPPPNGEDPPANNFVQTNASTYNIGQTIVISFGLVQQLNMTVTIEKQ